MIRLSNTDFSKSGLVIREAFGRASESGKWSSSASATHCIRWGEHDVVIGDILKVSRRGRVRLEVLSKGLNTRQGADLDVSPGGIFLPSGDKAPLLRTWFDQDYEDFVEYEYETPHGLLRTNNVYEIPWFGGEIVAEKWGDNAGMWIERRGPRDRIYHASHGSSDPPNFSDLVYRVTVTGARRDRSTSRRRRPRS